VGDGSAASLLRDRAVAILVSIEALTSLSIGATETALGWQAYGRRHDPLVLGLLGLAEFLPAVVLALPLGHLADRRDRRTLATAGLAGYAVVGTVLALDAGAGDHRVWPLYALACAGGVAHALINPALDPLLAASVPAGALSRALAIATSVGQAGRIAGPLTGGLLQRAGAAVPFAVGGVLIGLAAAMAFALPRALGRAHVPGETEEATFRDALGGVRFILGSPTLLGAVSLDLVAVLFGGVTALLPVFARDILHVGAVGNGMLRAAPAVGAVIVGIFLSLRPLRARIGATLFIVVAGYGVCTVVFGLSHSFALSLAALAGVSGTDMVSMLIRGTLVPLVTPPDLRGRVAAVERVFIGASNELGAFESGVAAALIGAVPAVVLGGAVSIAVAAVWSWRFPSLRQVDRFTDLPAAGGPLT
jgi:MFS family permease